MMKKIKLSLLILVQLCLVLAVVSCKKNEKESGSSKAIENYNKLIGEWQRFKKSDGISYIETYNFSGEENAPTRTGKFEYSLQPEGEEGIGYSVKGDWQVYYSGKVTLYYDLKTLTPLYNFKVDEGDKQAEVDIYSYLTEKEKTLESYNNSHKKSNKKDKENAIDRIAGRRIGISFDGAELILEFKKSKRVFLRTDSPDFKLKVAQRAVAEEGTQEDEAPEDTANVK